MDVGTLTVTMGANTAGLARAQQAMIQLQQQTMKSVNAMNASLNTLSAQMTKVATKSRVVGQSITAIEKPTVGAMSNITSALGMVNSSLQRFGYLATTTLTLPIVMAGKAAFTMAKDYEFSIQKIVGLTGVAQSVVNGWEKELLAMAPQVAKGPKELAEALYFISSSGIKGAEAMNVLKLSAKAASSGLGETQDVADLLTSALNAYRGTGLTAAYATDVLVAAVREGKAEATGFSTAMGQVIPIAAQLGVSFDQVAGGMAAITLTGSSAFQAATYLKGVFNSLLKATTQGEIALKTAGTSYAELRNILGNGGVIPLMQKLRDIQTKYGDELLSDVLPNIRALTGYLSLSGKNFQYNTELMKRVTESTGSLGKAFAAVADTIKIRYDSAIAKAQVSLISLGKSLAETVIPFLEKLGKKLEELATWFDSLSEAEKRHKIEIVALAAALGPLSLLFSSLIWFIRGMIVVGEKAIFVFKALRAVMISNPWTAAVVGVTGLIAGIALLNKHTKNAAEIQNSFNKALTTVNGSMKLLKDLTSSDYSNMDFNQLAAVRKIANEGYMSAKANIKIAEGRVASGEVGKGRMQKYIDSQTSAALEFKSVYNIAGKALDDLAAKWESNTMAEANQKFVANTNDTIKVVKEQTEALLRLNDAWAEIDQKAFEKRNPIGLTPSKKISWNQHATDMLNNFGLPNGAPKFKPDNDMTKFLSYQDVVVRNLNKDLAESAFMESFLGDTYDNTSAQVDAYTNALMEMYKMFPEGNAFMDEMKKKIQELNAELKREDAWGNWAKGIASAAKMAGDTLSALGNFFEASKNKELKAAGKNAKAIAAIEERYAKRRKAIAIIDAIINTAVAVSKSIRDSPLTFGLPWSAINAALGAAQVTLIASQPMKTGGIVPPGYQNDSYPALLTSGEMVTPPGKLAGIERQQPLAAQLKDVVFHIEGTQLVGVFKNQSRKQASYS